jgi:hypothetical protein
LHGGDIPKLRGSGAVLRGGFMILCNVESLRCITGGADSLNESGLSDRPAPDLDRYFPPKAGRSGF